ncbi:MAG TPA: RDD family protein [Rubricoccaceae bacterium]|nr:RDD family protein [Rubricoccaceae bacterium]
METNPGPSYTPPPAGAPPAGGYAPSMTASGYAKADLVKRFVASLIDGIIGGVLYAIVAMAHAGIGWLLYAAYVLIRDGLALDFMDGRSIGKKVMKLRPVRLDGGTMDIATSVKRNWPLALGSIVSGLLWLGGWSLYLQLSWLAMAASLLGLVEAILVLVDKDGRRIGDKMANTQVIDSEA